MMELCIHSNDIGEACDVRDIFLHHRKVKEEPQIYFKIQTYNQPNRKREHRRSYLTVIKMEN